MRTEQAFVGARGVDSFPYSKAGSAQEAQKLAASGIDFLVGYLGIISDVRLAAVLDAGLAFMPVTVAADYASDTTVRRCRSLGLPNGCTVWLDLEGQASYNTPAQELIGKINTWADAITAAGYMPGLYVGSPQPLTGDELYRLHVVRYWKAPSRVLDRFGKAWDGPGCGFCMWQMWPQGNWKDTGVFVDVDIVGQDFRGRVPSWVKA